MHGEIEHEIRLMFKDDETNTKEKVYKWGTFLVAKVWWDKMVDQEITNDNAWQLVWTLKYREADKDEWHTAEVARLDFDKAREHQRKMKEGLL